MKRNRNPLGDAFFKRFTLPKFRLGPALVCILAFVISGGVIIWGSMRSDIADAEGYTEFELGRVADRDIIAERAVSYVDETATHLRLEAEERLIPAVFVFSREAGEGSRRAYNRFAELSRAFFSQDNAVDVYKQAVEADFPGAFRSDTLDTLFRDPGRDRLLDYGAAVLEYLLDSGIVAMPRIGLERFNPDVVELYHTNGPRIERERVPYDRLITYAGVGDAVKRHIAAGT
jgi:hypothetical protein